GNDRHGSDRPDEGPDTAEDAAPGPLVAGAPGDVRGVRGLRRLRLGARVHGPRLLRLAVPLAVLLAVPGRLRGGCLRLRPAVPGVPVLGGPARPGVPAGLPDDLLLLPQGLLPRLLVLPARVRRRRAAQDLLRRDPLPTPAAERPPLVLVRRGAGRPRADLRHGAGIPQRGQGVGPHGPRHASDARQHRADLAVHALLPLVSPRGRRTAAALLQAPGALPALDLGVAAQRPPRPLRVVLLVLGGTGGPLRLPAGHRDDRGREVLL
ncbi:MAG: putative succinate dehydrogenase [membrane anchor subunit] (succinic dehydrogenase), partial [uncultured Nocardioides sp.]